MPRQFTKRLFIAVNQQQKYLNAKEVSAEYGFALKTLYKWVAANSIPHYRVNGVIKFSREKLDNWMSKKEVKVKAFIV